MNFRILCLHIVLTRVVCPNFGHPDLTSSFIKFRFLHGKNSFALIVNGLSVLKLCQLLKVDLLFFLVFKPRMTKLGQGVQS